MLNSIITSMGCKWIELFLEMLMGSVEGSLWLKHVCHAVRGCWLSNRVEQSLTSCKCSATWCGDYQWERTNFHLDTAVEKEHILETQQCSAFRPTSSDLVAVSANSRTTCVVLKCIKNVCIQHVHSFFGVMMYFPFRWRHCITALFLSKNLNQPYVNKPKHV